MPPEAIPGEWIQTKKLRNHIEGLLIDIQDIPEFKEVTPLQIMAALTQVSATYAGHALIAEIRQKRGKGLIFPMPV